MDQTEGKFSQEVQTIRNILFGEQLEELFKRIDDLEGEAKKLRQANKLLQDQLEETQQALLAGREKDRGELEAQISRLGGELEDRLGADKAGLEKELKSSKKYLSQRITDVRKKLSRRMDAEKLKQGDLIEMLAHALSAYQNGSDQTPE